MTEWDMEEFKTLLAELLPVEQVEVLGRVMVKWLRRPRRRWVVVEYEPVVHLLE